MTEMGALGLLGRPSEAMGAPASAMWPMGDRAEIERVDSGYRSCFRFSPRW